MAEITKRARYEQIRSALWTERNSFDAHWRELGDYIQPRRTRFFTSDRNRGDKRNQNIVDSTATFAMRTLQSGLHAGLTSPARPWFLLSTPDPALNRSPAVKAWLYEVTERLRSFFQRSNLYNALPTVYGDMGTFGTGAMGILDDAKSLFRAYNYPIGSYAIGCDARGLVTTWVYERDVTVRQLVEQFGGPDGMPLVRGQAIDWSHISTNVKNQWERGNYENPVTLVWVVMPNEDYRSDRLLAKYKRWSSCHYEKGAPEGEQQFLRESGYDTFPVLVPRWDVTGEDAYGTNCPGMIALGDIKQLQTAQREKAKAIQKMVSPPLVGDAAFRTQKVSQLPGDMNYDTSTQGTKGLRSVFDLRLDIDHLRLDINDTQARIQRACFEDLFLMLAATDSQRGSQPITAREVEERHEEKLLALGPVLERTNDELLDPLIDRAYALAEAAGLIPPAPPELEGVELKVEYISVLSQAQKLVGVVGQTQFLNSIVPLAEVFPEVTHKIDMFRVIDNYADMLGVDPQIVRPTEDAEARMEQQAQQQQAAMAAEQAKTLAQATQAAANAPMDGDNALGRLLGAA